MVVEEGRAVHIAPPGAPGPRLTGFLEPPARHKPLPSDNTIEWLNQVERFFALITDKAIRRGSFTSVKQLVQRIDHFVTTYNSSCRPFKWTATADSILAKLHRLCSRISGTEH